MTTEIDVVNLNKSFGKRKVLDNVSFQVKKGGFLSIFGPNGAGKTTLIKILSTLVAPTSGKVLVSGISLDDDPTLIRKKIGLISHSPLLYPDLNAYENLKFYGTLYQVPHLEKRINFMLDKVELSHRRYDLVRTFSKGMQQRLAIARVLLHQPAILFLDEPHSGLDPHAVDILDGLINDIRGDHTFVMITHSLEKGIALADVVMILENGKIIFYQEKEHLDSDKFRKIYIQTVKGES
ncbi:MAG: ABC transporter ATP-binding protein [Actinobacteria bacterium]|nr:ABC transporter ATP-binding protein [Actinomycetota bacterium]